MANLKVGNREFERSPIWTAFDVGQDPTMTAIAVDTVTGLGLTVRYGSLGLPSFPYISTSGSLKIAVIANGSKMYWKVPLTAIDTNLPLSFGVGYLSPQAAAANKTFTPVLKWQVIGPGTSSTGSSTAPVWPPAPANSPDQAFGVHTLAAQNSWQWTGTGSTPYPAATPAIINASNILPYQNVLSYLLVEVQFNYGAGLTDLYVTDLFVQGTPLITPTPDETVIDPILKA